MSLLQCSTSADSKDFIGVKDVRLSHGSEDL